MFAENFLLDDVRNYRYLTHGNVGCTLDDHELYQELVEAFDIMGLNTDEKAGNYNVSMHVKKRSLTPGVCHLNLLVFSTCT